MLYPKRIKRILDVLFSLLFLPILLIITIVVAPMIWIEDGGPIFFRAKRLGIGGEVFVMYKFRSMYMNAPDLRNQDGSTYSGDGDARVTRIGRILRRTSIDELPQFFNVLKGEMSVIGPRPDLPDHILLYEGDEHDKLQVRPGITGLSQAYYRNSIPWKERLRLDSVYSSNCSFLLDCRILFRTMISLLRLENVNSPQ